MLKKAPPPSYAQAKSSAAAAPNKPPAKLPSKPLPPSQAVRETKNEAGRGGRGCGCRYGRGRESGGFSQGFFNNENIPAGKGALEDGDSGKSLDRRGYGGRCVPFRGGRRGEFSNGKIGDGERPRRPYERRSGTGRGNEIERGGAGCGN